MVDKVLDYNQHGRIELIHDVLSPEVTKSKGRFLQELVRTLRDVAVVLIVAALVLIPAAALMGYERGKNQPGPEPPEGLVTRTRVIPPFGPGGPVQGVALVQDIMEDLNEGTRLVDASVVSLDARDLDAASLSLAELNVFVLRAEPVFCDADAVPGSWREAELNQVLGQACAGVRIQRQQWQTLDDLARDVAEQGEEVLFDPARRASVVGVWDGYERSFDQARASINTILEVWSAVLGSEP